MNPILDQSGSDILDQSGSIIYDQQSALGDPYWANVSSLVYFDDNAGTTLPYDTKLDEQWIRSGDAVIQDTVTLFGDNTGYCDGSGDRFYSNPSAAFTLGTDDFTAEMWIRPVNGGAGFAYGRIFQFGPNTTNTGLYVVRANNPNPLKTLVQGYNGGFYNVFTSTSGGSLPNDTWTHYALCRKNGVFTEFLGGVQNATNDPSQTDNFNHTVLHVGGNSIGGETFRGYFSNLRITKGVARYTTSFTPPTEKFPAASQLLVADPASIIVAAGDDAIFTGSASEGQPPYTYQWYEVTAGLLSGQTDAVLTLPAVDATYDGTDYYYTATDNVGQTATSGTASLNVEGSTNPVLTNYEDALVMDAGGVWQSLTKPLIDDTRLVRDFTWSSNQIGTYVAQRTRWKGAWSPSEYVKNDQVLDDGWLMIANKTTTDRAAPQPRGPQSPAYPADNTTTQSASATQVIFGQRYTGQSGTIRVIGCRIFIAAENVGSQYRIFAVSDPLGASPVVSEVLQFTAANTGWREVTTNSVFIRSGQTFDLVASVQDPPASPTTFQGDWDYATPQNPLAPTAGQIQHSRAQPSVFEISTTDANSGDRTAELSSLGFGDTIDDGTVNWTIQSVTNNATYFTFGVSPAVNSTLGTKTFTFSTITPTPISYEEDTGYWLGEPLVQGLLGIDEAYGDIVPDDNQYGLDAILQNYYFSPDWDIQSTGSA